MRHDARTRRTLLGQFHKRKVLRVKQTGVESQLSQRTGNGSHGEAHVALHLAAPHLGIHHVIVHRVEA